MTAHTLYIADSTARDLAASAYLVIIRSTFYSKIDSQDRLRPTLEENFEAQRIPGSIDDVGLPRGSWMFRVP